MPPKLPSFPFIRPLHFSYLLSVMGCEIKREMWVVVMCILVIGTIVSSVHAQQVPCYFIFGDSLVDNGNNNRIVTTARANYFPYGIDFGGPTGRFSNGVTTVDVIADLLGFRNYIPPYANVRGRQLLGGANFASAAAGIRDETGQQLGARITMNGQLRNYQNAVTQIVSIFGDENQAADYLSQCIYTVGMGSNDYLNNYFQPAFYSTSRIYTPEQYADVLIQEFTQQLRTLYNYGARKVAIVGVGAVGCAPSQLETSSPNGVTCVERVNSANRLFNQRLISLVDNFNNNLVGASFTYINAYGVFDSIRSSPSSYGISNINRGCCGIGRNNGLITCLPLQTPCGNRNQYLFWDAFHPTAAANIVIGRRSYRAQNFDDVYPIDIERLARI